VVARGLDRGPVEFSHPRKKGEQSLTNLGGEAPPELGSGSNPLRKREKENS